MQLAIVKGRATATVKHPSMSGQKLSVCLVLDAVGTPSGDPLLVVDSHGAGAGDVVMISSDGQGVRELLDDDTSPVRWFTLGIVDEPARPAAARS
jgi:ethanolamine utilization protein EutN